MFTMRARNVIDSSSTYWEMAENFDQLSEVQYHVQRNCSDSSRQTTSEEEKDTGLSSRILRRVSALRTLQAHSDAISLQYKEERIKLEKKYHGMLDPYLVRGLEFISGEAKVSETCNIETCREGIPGYWTQCFVNHPAIQLIITPEDIPALDALTNVECEYNEEYTAFVLRFHFAENDYFFDEVLEKMYVVGTDLLEIDMSTLIERTTTDIEWKPFKNLCVVESRKKKMCTKGRNKGQTQIVPCLESRPSFFHFFAIPTDDVDESGWDPSHGVSGITFSSEDDYEIATCIRTSIIPASVRWYTGEAAEDDFSRHLQDIPEEDGVSVFDTPVCGPSACAVTVTKVAETEAVDVMKQSEQGGPHRSPI